MWCVSGEPRVGPHTWPQPCPERDARVHHRAHAPPSFSILIWKDRTLYRTFSRTTKYGTTPGIGSSARAALRSVPVLERAAHWVSPRSAAAQGHNPTYSQCTLHVCQRMPTQPTKRRTHQVQSSQSWHTQQQNGSTDCAARHGMVQHSAQHGDRSHRWQGDPHRDLLRWLPVPRIHVKLYR